MARLIPDDIQRLDLATEHSGELDTLQILKKGLSDDYTVFHSVHWTRENERYTVFGEIDFVIVNQSGNVLIIEQKNGALDETVHGLVKRYYGGNEKNVVQQIHRSLDNIRNKFKAPAGNKNKLNVDYLIYCPDYKVLDINAAGVDNLRCVDATNKKSLSANIHELLTPGNISDKEWRDIVLNFFSQRFEVIPDIHAYKNAQEKSFIRLSSGLVKLVSNLEMKPFRLRVQGVAGSGKSQLAYKYYNDAISQGKRPLLLCFNRLLAESFKANVNKGGIADTWHGFCVSFLKDCGHKFDFPKKGEDSTQFWKNVVDMVIGEDIPDDWRFDVVIVDEGQDFKPDWYDVLSMFKKPDTDVLWLEDHMQNIRQTEAIYDDRFVTYRTLDNYRTPYHIAQFIQETLPFEFNCANNLPGLGGRVHKYSNPEQQIKLVSNTVLNLIKAGFKHEDIVILSCCGTDNSNLSEIDKIANIALNLYVGEYDSKGNQLNSEGRIIFDSIYRFKGQQAPAIILTDIDPDPDKFDKYQRVLFTGMTRATVRLDLMVNENNDLNKLFLDRE